MRTKSNLIKSILLQKNKLIFVCLIVISIVTYGYLFPSVHYFKCEGRSLNETIDGKRMSSVSQHIKVKKYLYGYEYSINQYNRADCSSLLEDEIYCSNSGNNDWLAFNIATSQLNGYIDYSSLNKSKILSESFWNIECTKINRAID